jgi:hypothetical protein
VQQTEQSLDEQLNDLFATSHEIDLAQIKGDTREARLLLADGLAQSCHLLHEIQEIEPLQSVEITDETSKLVELRLLRRRDLLEKFLETEKGLLKLTTRVRRQGAGGTIWISLRAWFATKLKRQERDCAPQLCSRGSL